MTTTYTKPRDPAVVGNLSNGRDEPSSLSAESPTPAEIDPVKHDGVHLRDDRREHASLPGQFPSQSFGQVSLIDPPRASYMLLDERTSLQRSSVLPHETEVSTIANEPVLAGVQHGKGEDVEAEKPECPSANIEPTAPRDDSSSGAEIIDASVCDHSELALWPLSFCLLLLLYPSQHPTKGQCWPVLF